MGARARSGDDDPRRGRRARRRSRCCAATPGGPDGILLDVMMPGMDGPDTLAAIRALGGYADLPIIFMTARARKADLDGYNALGANGVIVKPFDPMHLAEGRPRADRRQPTLDLVAAHALVVADHLVDDEAQELLGEIGIEDGRPRQARAAVRSVPPLGPDRRAAAWPRPCSGRPPGSP